MDLLRRLFSLPTDDNNDHNDDDDIRHLFDAARDGNLPIFQSKMTHMSRIRHEDDLLTAKDEFDCSFLQLAAIHGHESVVLHLLSQRQLCKDFKEGLLDFIGKQGHSALSFSVINGYILVCMYVCKCTN